MTLLADLAAGVFVTLSANREAGRTAACHSIVSRNWFGYRP
jgi:hypothetical protein